MAADCCGWDRVDARAVAEKVLAFFRSRSSWIVDFRLFSRAASERRSAKVVLGFSGVVVGGFQGFLRDTSEAFFPLSIPSKTLCGDVDITATISNHTNGYDRRSVRGNAMERD